MPNVAVQKLAKTEATEPLPILQAIEKQFDEVRRRAFDLFEQRGRELGRDIDDWLKAEHEILGWPAAELSEKNANYEMDMKLPGFDPKEVEVTVTPTEIIVHAATKHQKKTEDAHVLWSEFSSDDVYRRFELPAAIDVDKTTATLDNGMLHVVASKAAAPTPIVEPAPTAKPVKVATA
jgi:HSP20 family protein